MKKSIFILLMCLTSFFMVNAQKESGVVYSEHESIGKTKAMWEAFVKGDKETFISFFADTVKVVLNGVRSEKLKEEFAKNIDWWQGVENLAIKDDIPAFPDAIQYKKEGLWVQDWLRATGIHKETGVNIDFPFYNSYRFNKDGKINTLAQYFNPDIFKIIEDSKRTIENGTVYINHPYIVTVRKCVNAYCAKDIETMRSFYSPKATFWRSDFEAGKRINLDEKLNGNKRFFDACDNIKLQQVGYPDCIYYARDANYLVYSWWNMSFTTKDGKAKKDITLFLISCFDEDGKINMEAIYPGSNFFE